jgi:DNA-binding transcriptional LysR family regulator
VNERKIATFLTTAHAGSMSAAAARLGCTQSAVTQTVSGLEAELGCKLFERGPSGAALTENGRVLLPTAVQAHALLRRLREEAAAVSSGQEPPVRVGCFSSIACTWLPGAIAAWRRRNPQARFEVRVGTDELAGWLRAGQVDLALGDVERLREFAWEPLAEDRYLAVVPARYLDEHPGLGAGGYLTREELFGLPSALEPFNAAERLEDVERPPTRCASPATTTRPSWRSWRAGWASPRYPSWACATYTPTCGSSSSGRPSPARSRPRCPPGHARGHGPSPPLHASSWPGAARCRPRRS